MKMKLNGARETMKRTMATAMHTRSITNGTTGSDSELMPATRVGEKNRTFRISDPKLILKIIIVILILKKLRNKESKKLID